MGRGANMTSGNAQEYLIRALTYSASYGFDSQFECANKSGRDIADFLVRSVDVRQFENKDNMRLLHFVPTMTWWKMLRGAYAKLGDLDELKVATLLETSGHWHWGVKPKDAVKQKFNTTNLGRLYHDVRENGWRLINSESQLRGVVDRFNEAK